MQTSGKKRWKPIPGFPRYLASTRGRVLSVCGPRPLVLKPRVQTKGYLTVMLHEGGKRFDCLIHRLVLLAFCGRSRRTGNHKDKDKRNNSLSNLEYMTLRNNIRHSREARRATA